MAAMGIETLILTNAAGSTNPKFQSGKWMQLSDQLNLSGQTPLLGGPNFFDMSAIYDAKLRAKFSAMMMSLGVSSTLYGTAMTAAAYSPEGAKWVDEMRAYIAENARVFDEGINAIPGLKSMPMDSTYLAWVDFSGTGMPMDEVLDRVRKQAKIAPNDGPTFGTGGEPFLRFNLGTPRVNVEEAVSRLKSAFADLQ